MTAAPTRRRKVRPADGIDWTLAQKAVNRGITAHRTSRCQWLVTSSQPEERGSYRVTLLPGGGWD